MAALTVGGAFLSASLQVLFDKLASPTLQEVGSLWGVGYELHHLRRTLLKILSVVDNIEMRSITDCSTKIWMNELKDAAYDAEDILDEFEAEVLRQQVESGCQVSNFFSSLTPNQVLFNREISKKTNIIREKLDEIARDKHDLKLGEWEDRMRRPETIRWRESSSIIDNGSGLIGREEDLNKVVKMLVSDAHPSNGMNVSGVIISGMGGIGKTILAQWVYNEERVDSYFELKMWVCVSEDFDARRITREITESASSGRYTEVTNWNMIQENLKEKLRGVRFLLVLDDVWNDNRYQWEQLYLPLLFGGKGSKILITTRNKNVVNIMDSTTLYCLEGISDHDCWIIFRKSAFPLAANMLGSLLKSKLDEDTCTFEAVLRLLLPVSKGL